MTTNPTPGPWTREYGQRFIHDASAGIKAGGLYIAAALDFNQFSRDEEVEANARLIAASPDLLQALELALRYLDHPEVKSIPFALPVDAAIDQARAAIAKARGE